MHTKKGKVLLRTEETLILNILELKIIIEDFGLGISEKALPHIFERFYREDEARNREIKSYGLGLSIVKEILNLLNIDIHIESQLGRGTKITLEI